jgi:hypothetical protein
MTFSCVDRGRSCIGSGPVEWINLLDRPISGLGRNFEPTPQVSGIHFSHRKPVLS